MSTFLSRRVNVEDLRGAPDWVPVLIAPLNLQNEDLVNLLNGKLQIGSNINGMTFTTSFTTSATYATGDFAAINFNYVGKYSPTALLIGQLTCTKPASTILTPTSLSWQFNNSASPSQIKITYVAGLLPSRTYSITVVAL